MPLVEVQIVEDAADGARPGLARALADAIAQVYQAAPATVWVRLELLDPRLYAENDASGAMTPVFLRVLLADLPSPAALRGQAAALAAAVAAVLARSQEHIHIEFLPPGRGRVAFGGVLLQ